MFNRNIEQGIAAIQAGKIDEGARMLKIALKDPALVGTMRAVACLWLAETTPDPQAKRTYYSEALEADPENPQIQQRVQGWMATQLMPPTPVANTPIPPGATPPPTAPIFTGDTGRQIPINTGDSGRIAAVQPPPPSLPGTGSLFQPPQQPAINPYQNTPYAQPQVAPPATAPSVYNTPPYGSPPATVPAMTPAAGGGIYRIVGVYGGPNGPGTAFFVAREGLLATTRYVVGGVDRLTVELETGRQIPGHVVRAFPEFDLAFIYVEQSVSDTIPVTPLPRLPDELPLTVVSYNGQAVRGLKRTTRRMLSPQWFPTDISELPDAGGGPVLDDQHYLIGMITRATSSTSNLVYGLHINVIRQLVETFRQETLSGSRLYCPHCGSFSQAPAAGGYYCEVCGALTPQAEQITRFRQPHTDRFYREYSQMACMHCNATVGFHKGACLRCGREPG